MMKQTCLHDLSLKYTETGIIDDALVPYYDQHGKWRGPCGKPLGQPTRPWSERMRGSYLPPPRRTTRTRMGTLLMTSFYQRGNEAVLIKYCGIEGSLVIAGDAPIHAPSLRRIGGNLISPTTKRVHLPSLATVGGHLELLQTFLFSSPRLRHVGGSMMIVGMQPPLLETVGGRLGVYWAFSFEASKLNRVGGCLVLSQAGDIHVPKLESVGGGVLLSHLARTFIAPKLQSVGGDFLAGSVTRIRVPTLECVGGDLDSSSAKSFYHPFIRVGGDWTVYEGDIEEWHRRDAARQRLRGDEPPLFV